jgi:hypothetical protein
MNRAEVIEYLELHAQSSTCEKRLRELRAALLPQLRAGEESPGDLPYRLVMRLQKRQVKDYLTPLAELLTRMWGKAAVDKRVRAIEANFASTEIEQLCVEQNKAFAAELGQAQPAA